MSSVSRQGWLPALLSLMTVRACARIPAGEEALLPHVLVKDQGEQHGDKEPGEPAPLDET